MNKRRDKRGRILHNGEYQLPDGRYRYKYTDSFGKRKYVYSLRLDHNDPMPKGHKNAPALRDLEKQIQADMFRECRRNSRKTTWFPPLGKMRPLARDGVSREVPCSALKGETVPLHFCKSFQFLA